MFCYSMWFVILLYDFNITFCGISIALYDFIYSFLKIDFSCDIAL